MLPASELRDEGEIFRQERCRRLEVLAAAVRVDRRRAVGREERRDLALRFDCEGRVGREARLPARITRVAVGFGTVLSPRANWKITGIEMCGAQPSGLPACCTH